MKFSANLGFLFSDLTLPDAVRAAAKAGFGAVELHWPYATDPAVFAPRSMKLDCRSSHSTPRPAPRAGRFRPVSGSGQGEEARRAIDEAVAYAVVTGAANIHVMAGRAEGDVARATFLGNLRYADKALGARAIGILIEPLNRRDAPGYFLRTLDEAIAVQDATGIGRLKILFDCYHLQIEGGDLLNRAKANLDRIGHVQIAAVPDRGEPDRGEVGYDRLLPAIATAGYSGWFGAEYRPRTDTVAGLAWLNAFVGQVLADSRLSACPGHDPRERSPPPAETAKSAHVFRSDCPEEDRPDAGPGRGFRCVRVEPGKAGWQRSAPHVACRGLGDALGGGRAASRCSAGPVATIGDRTAAGRPGGYGRRAGCRGNPPRLRLRMSRSRSPTHRGCLSARRRCRASVRLIASRSAVPAAIAQPVVKVAATVAASGRYSDGVYTGPAVDAYYGIIQIQAIVQNGQLAGIKVLRYPSDRRTSVAINRQALPMLRDEVISAQSSEVDIISGATLTSEAFIQSLRGALGGARA